MGRIQHLRGREQEGVRVNGFCAPDQRLYKGHAPPKSEDGWSSEGNRPEFTTSRSSANKVKFEWDYPALCWPELRDLKKIGAIPSIPR